MGGGVCGLASGVLLARDGHEVTVLERDAAPVPESVEEAWEEWRREGVIQFRQAHYLLPAGRAVLEQALPDAVVSCRRALRASMRSDSCSSLADLMRPAGDERFVTFTARRSTIEQVLAKAAEGEPGVEVRRGCEVKELVMRSGNGTPHVTGVRIDSDQTLNADLVVDAMGRRSQLPRWCTDANIGPVHEESEDCGFIYYTRFFRSANGTTPEFRAPLVSPIGTFSIGTFPADNGIWSVTTMISSGDQPLKRMRDHDPWSAVVEACPLHAHWLESEPISGVLAMGGVIDRYRRLLHDGRPLLTGIVLLGDAWACTNPSLGRGISLGLLHAKCLREAVSCHLEDPLGVRPDLGCPH